MGKMAPVFKPKTSLRRPRPKRPYSTGIKLKDRQSLSEIINK